MKHLSGGISVLLLDRFFLSANEKTRRSGSVFPKREFNPRSLSFFFDYFQTFAFKIKREANNAVSNRLERSKTNI